MGLTIEKNYKQNLTMTPIKLLSRTSCINLLLYGMVLAACSREWFKAKFGNILEVEEWGIDRGIEM